MPDSSDPIPAKRLVMQVAHCTGGALSTKGDSAALFVEFLDGRGERREGELRFASLPGAATPVIAHLLKILGAAGATRAKLPNGLPAGPVAATTIQPERVALGLAGPGEVRLSLQFGVQSIDFALPVEQLQPIAEFLSAQALLARREPQVPQ